MMLMLTLKMVNTFKYETKLIRKTEAITDRPGNQGDGDREDQPPMQPLNTEKKKFH